MQIFKKRIDKEKKHILVYAIFFQLPNNYFVKNNKFEYFELKKQREKF